MDQFETPILPFAAKRDLVKHEGCGQIRQVTLQRLLPTIQRPIVQTARKRQVKPKLLENVRVTPLRQQSFLPGAKTRLAPPRKLCLARWRAKPVKIAHADLSNTLQAIECSKGRESQKSAQLRQPQPVTNRGRKRASHVGHSCFKTLKRLSFLQAKGRFQSSMKAIFARCHRDVMQTGHIELNNLTARHSIPAEPFCAEVGQRAVGRHIVNCETSV